MSRNRRSFWLLVAVAMMAFMTAGCSRLVIHEPCPITLYEAGDVDVEIWLPAKGDLDTLLVELDDGTTVSDVTGLLSFANNVLTGQVSAPTTGVYTLRVQIDTSEGETLERSRSFETLALINPDNCEVLNSAHCMLPYPSDVFLVEDLTRPPGFNPRRVDVDPSALPVVVPPLDPAPYNDLDGTSPTAQILMHFPGPGVDLVLSNASRLLPPGSPVSPPYVDTRTHDDTSLLPDSPSVLIDAETGERVMHFLEVDARAEGNPARQALIMRPARALTPGHRYIVAIRDLVDVLGDPVEAEAPFAALRDFRPTTIDAIRFRRGHYEFDIFPRLALAGVHRANLILAFDFTVQSEAALTSAVLSMRDQSYAWLGAGNAAFTVNSVEENDCSVPGQVVWRVVRGTFEVPLFLTADPEPPNTYSLGVLNDTDSDGLPDQNGVTNPPYTISLPCSALEEGGPIPHPILLGHGLFGLGNGMVTDFADFLGETYIAGATNWRGLAQEDLYWVAGSIVGVGSSKLNNFPALPDRLKQGQTNTQVLARMMKHGLFNTHACFQIRDPLPANCTAAGPDPSAIGVFPGSPTEDVEMFYYGISLGGIMGTWFAALTPDVERFNLDVPAINFSILLQRSTQFVLFDPLLDLIGLSDPMEKVLGLGLIHELWVKGEPAGYVHSLASEVASNDKKLLITMAWLDKQVSNQATEIMARSLGVPNLVGSVQEGLQEIPDQAGPLDSALVIYDTGFFDIFDPDHYGVDANGRQLIPPLANLFPSDVCDPHSERLTIPASLDQVAAFLQPGGQILNFCTGVCDGAEVYEQPAGGLCDPLNP